MLIKKNISYYGYRGKNPSPGVVNKINQTVSAFLEMGFLCEEKFVRYIGLKSHYELIKSIIADQADIIIYRYYPNSPVALFVAGALLYKRLKGAKIIIDVPTPVVVVINEIYNSRETLFRKFVGTFFIMVNNPFCLWPSHRIIQYAPEASWFELGLRKRTIFVGNGVKVDDFNLQDPSPAWNGAELHLVGVAAVSESHGYDRIIRGIANYYKQITKNACNIRFSIVGSGPICPALLELSQQLAMENHVTFSGEIYGDELTKVFQDAHIGVGVLAGYRKGLIVSSALKNREYTARGVPFIDGSDDPDFDPQPFFLYKVTNTNDPLDITGVIDWYNKIRAIDNYNQKIRDYAEAKLDYKGKLPRYLDNLIQPELFD